VAVENTRIAELRRRLQQDPASIAFAQLAEEYRRAGHYAEAVTCCRAGLGRHPGYLSARVTLGRALMELGRLDEAARELTLVLDSAPDNLSALQAMADVHERRGALTEALTYYKRALTIARFDPRIEASVTRIDRELGASPHAAEAPAEPFKPARSLMDFDALLTSLGTPDATPPPLVNHLLAGGAPLAEFTRETTRGANPPRSLDRLEQELRAFNERGVHPDDAVLEELERWLRALVAETRDARRGA
jgi:tetratricopeptide (TPR) repeat protein